MGHEGVLTNLIYEDELRHWMIFVYLLPFIFMALFTWVKSNQDQREFESIKAVAKRLITKLEVEGHVAEKCEVACVNPTHLLWMLYAISTEDSDMPLSKRQRWLGYIQGVLSAHGIIDPEEERNETRPILNGV